MNRRSNERINDGISHSDQHPHLRLVEALKHGGGEECGGAQEEVEDDDRDVGAARLPEEERHWVHQRRHRPAGDDDAHSVSTRRLDWIFMTGHSLGGLIRVLLATRVLLALANPIKWGNR